MCLSLKSDSVFRIKHNDTYLFRPSLPMESNIELQIRNIRMAVPYGIFFILSQMEICT